MAIYEASVRQMGKMLVNLDRCLERAVEYADDKDFDADVLLASRLAPDQYALARQVQSACDGAKFGVARLTGKEPPKHPDTEETIEELRARIASVVSYLESFTAADFEGTDDRVIDLPLFQGKVLAAPDYLVEMVMPNFYFHVAHVYALLRHDGVGLSKRDYLGRLALRPRS